VARSRLIFGEDASVAKWCESRIAHFSGWGTAPKTIGYEIDGELKGGVVYTNFSGANVFATIALEAPLTRRFLFTIFWCPFVQFGVRHISCAIEESNRASIKLCAHLGFRLRGRLPESAINGEDVIIMGMLKRDCKWLALGPKP
jgi:RimJ/RimL family protein N-acetyltransferase